MSESTFPEAVVARFDLMSRVTFILRLGEELTIATRSALVDQDVRCIDGINELQHSLWQQARHLLLNDGGPELMGFLSSLRDAARQLRIAGAYRQAVEHALIGMPAPAPA